MLFLARVDHENNCDAAGVADGVPARLLFNHAILCIYKIVALRRGGFRLPVMSSLTNDEGSGHGRFREGSEGFILHLGYKEQEVPYDPEGQDGPDFVINGKIAV